MSTTGPYDKSERVELADEAVHWDLGSSLSYGEYLHLDKLLDAQQPLSSEHNEMLFIIVHQVSELWMRLVLHELTAALHCVRQDDLDPALKMLARISRTQTQLISVWEVLSTLTPFEYSAFRNALGRSSGFQSLQYRLIEFLFGNKNADMVRVHQRDARSFEILQRALESPSLYDEVLRLLSRRGYEIPAGLPHSRFQSALPRQQADRGRLARRLSQRRNRLGPVRAGRAPRGPRSQLPALALSSHEDRRAHHRLQARYGRHGRCVVPGQGAGAEVLSGAVADPHLDVVRVRSLRSVPGFLGNAVTLGRHACRTAAVHQYRALRHPQVRNVAARIAVSGQQPARVLGPQALEAAHLLLAAPVRGTQITDEYLIAPLNTGADRFRKPERRGELWHVQVRARAQENEVVTARAMLPDALQGVRVQGVSQEPFEILRRPGLQPRRAGRPRGLRG